MRRALIPSRETNHPNGVLFEYRDSLRQSSKHSSGSDHPDDCALVIADPELAGHHTDPGDGEEDMRPQSPLSEAA